MGARARGRSPEMMENMVPGQFGYLQQSQDMYRRTGKIVPDGRRGIVDRAAYMSFLESQLERVTASCKTVESYNTRIDTIQDAVAGAETRIANNTRLVKIAQSFAEQVEDDMKKFKHVYGTKFQRMDESVGQALDIHQKVLDRIDALERIADKTDRSIQQVEERVAFSLSKHSLHTEEMVCAMEERVMIMLKGYKEDMQSSIDRTARETRELLSSITEGRRDELLERERFQQSILEESRRQHDEWQAQSKEMRRRADEIDARIMRAAAEAVQKADSAVGRLSTDVQDVEGRLAGEVRQAVAEIRDAELRLARGVEATLMPLSSTARDLELVRRDVVRLDSERLKMKDLLLTKMSDIDKRASAAAQLGGSSSERERGGSAASGAAALMSLESAALSALRASGGGGTGGGGGVRR